MDDHSFDPDEIIERFRMPFHLATAFKGLCKAAAAGSPEEKIVFTAAAQEHVDKELQRLRTVLINQSPQPQRLFGAVLDPDYGLAEEALTEAYEQRELLRAQRGDPEK